VKTLCSSNLKLNTTVNQLADELQTKHTTFNKLKEQNEILKAQEASLLGQMSKAKIVAVIDKKINLSSAESDSLAKAFCKGGSKSTRDFLDEFLEKRKAFHKYQILKVVINKQA
jgi:Modifier of rudimentary (Mod(r)) protein